MDTTDKLAAAIFAAARCSAFGNREPKDYLDQYDLFIQLMNDRKAEAAAKNPLKITDEALDVLRKP